jgi:hypothetical protein
LNFATVSAINLSFGRRVSRTQAGSPVRSLQLPPTVMLYVIHVYQFSSNELISTIRVDGLATNGFFDGGSCKTAWRSSALFPLLQRSFRDLQFQRRLAF